MPAIAAPEARPGFGHDGERLRVARLLEPKRGFVRPALTAGLLFPNMSKEHDMKRRQSILAATAALALAALAAAPARAAEAAGGHISIIPAELRWVDAPSIGPGAKLAVLEGDLKEAVPITFRLKLPPNLQIPVHTHPVPERVTVISGTFHLGIGEVFDAAKARAYPAGGITVIPPGMPMYAYTGDEEAELQIHGMGPWGISYRNPAEDPRNK